MGILVIALSINPRPLSALELTLSGLIMGSRVDIAGDNQNPHVIISKYCPRPTKPVDIPTIFVYDRQNRLIYQPIFVHDRKKLGEIPTFIVHNGQNRVIYKPVLFMAHNPGIYNNQYCPRQTKTWDKPINIVSNRQNCDIFQP